MRLSIEDLRNAFASIDQNNDGIVAVKDIPSIFAQLDITYKSMIAEGDELKRLVDKIDIESKFGFFNKTIVTFPIDQQIINNLHSLNF